MTEHFYVGTHTHRHGVSTYLFRTTGTITLEDFIKWLGQEYEPDREEFVEIDRIIPIDWEETDVPDPT